MAIRCRRYFLRSSRGRLLNRLGAFLRSQAGRVGLRLTRALAGGKRPIRVLEGRLNIAQDAVLGWLRRGKVPQGRLKELSKHGSAFGERIGTSRSRLFSRWRCLGLPLSKLSRPYGTFRLAILYRGLRPGLSSAVPAGLILQSPCSHTHARARSLLEFRSPTKEAA